SFNLRVPFALDTFNHWQFRKPLVTETIQEFNPDLLGTQECLHQQAEYLENEMPQYTFIGVGRNDGKESGEMAGMFFKTSKFMEIDHGHFWLSETPSTPGSKSWGTAYTRMCSWVKLRPKAGGETFCWFNTHFDNM